ncbi:MAG: cytochrome c [Candidatus Promineifilaceae bacterium]|nr:cytochrome c [Candidatus Promineifilaceae bacterium]
MRRALKWVGIVLGSLIGLLIIAYVAVVIIVNQRANREYDVPAADLTIPTDAESIAEGQRLIAIRGCSGCHGNDYSGQLLIDDPALGTFYTANLTGGAGSRTAEFTAADWDRAIRHGVGPDGKPLWVMPSQEYARISNQDLSLMIAYLESLPAVDNERPEQRLGPMGHVLVATGQLPAFSAEVIDHDNPPPDVVEAEVSVAYGEYLATTCTGCHGENFAGGPIPGAPPDHPHSANLTPGGELANWTEEDFINTLRTGVTPEGEQLDPEVMPWPIAEQMTDEDLRAIWLYLQSLDPVEPES